jgi:ribosomal protein L37AE/L43A
MPDLRRDLEATTGDRYRCPLCDARRGLSLDQDEGQTGVWHCFSCQDGGTGAELYAELRGVSIGEALDAYGVSQSELSGSVKRKEKRAPKPIRDELSEHQWRERCRLWKQMNGAELHLLDEYRRRRVAAQEGRDREAFDRWEQKTGDLYAVVHWRLRAQRHHVDRLDTHDPNR